MDSMSSSLISITPNQNLLLHPSKHIIKSATTRAAPLLTISAIRIANSPEPPRSTRPSIKLSRSPNSNGPTRASIQASVKVENYPKPQLPMAIFDVFHHIIKNFISAPLKPWADPSHVLAGNFAPVDELPPTECEVELGTLPPCLNGAYIRNGPNPQFWPQGQYHWFDGDGMLHSIRISSGRARLCSRYVKTYKYNVEHEMGSSVLPNIFSGFNGLVPLITQGAVFAARVLVGQFNLANGIGLANTSLAFFGSRLYALCESDLPYSIRITMDCDIETVGQHDFDGELVMSITAHPKKDPETGETFAFKYSHVQPFLNYFYLDSNGRKQQDVPIFSMSAPSPVHDFAITRKYAIFPQTQIEMSLMKMISGAGSPFGVDQKNIPRIGIIPRYAKDESEMKWFDVPGFNAWDDENSDVVEVIASNISSPENMLGNMELMYMVIERITIDMRTGIVSRRPLSTMNLDLAVLNPAYVGRPSRFVYAAVGDPVPKLKGVVKLDVLGRDDRQECIVASRMYESGCLGGEPFFVAREPDNPEAEEDDGYLVCYVHNERSGESRFLVMDAKSPELEIVAAVKLPCQVPYGFHGLFVRENDLNKL